MISAPVHSNSLNRSPSPGLSTILPELLASTVSCIAVPSERLNWKVRVKGSLLSALVSTKNRLGGNGESNLEVISRLMYMRRPGEIVETRTRFLPLASDVNQPSMKFWGLDPPGTSAPRTRIDRISKAQIPSRHSPREQSALTLHGPRRPDGARHAPFWHVAPGAELQIVPLGRSLTAHCPCALQVSCAEHSVGPAPQLAPVLGLKELTLRAGSQIWQALAGLSAPKPKQLAPIVQPSQLHEFVSGSQLRLVPQLRLPAATHWPPWH